MQNLTLHEGATLRCLLSASANSRFTVSGSIRHNGDTILVVVPANRKLNEDEELTIFPAGFTSASGEVIVKCETADGKDYMFDTSTLNSDGKIRVSAVCSGILDGITSNDTMVDVYTTSGIRLRSHVRRADALTGLPAGIYMMRAGTAAQNVVKRK